MLLSSIAYLLVHVSNFWVYLQHKKYHIFNNTL